MWSWAKGGKIPDTPEERENSPLYQNLHKGKRETTEQP